jgi:zinc/manganese transport system permease protein
LVCPSNKTRTKLIINKTDFILVIGYYQFIILFAIFSNNFSILLVNGFKVIPAASARLICQQFVPFLATAAGIGALSGLIGMIISGAIDLPSDSSIVLVQLFGFLAVALWCRQG